MKLLFHPDRSEERLQFIYTENGSLFHKQSQLVVTPVQTEAWCDNENYLVLKEADEGTLEHKWKLNDEFCLEHVGSGMCVHPRGGAPNENIHLVLWGEGKPDGKPAKRLQFKFIAAET